MLMRSTPVSATEIDASCRGPVLLLFVSAAAWALISSIFGMIATLKFHNPNILANNPLLTYGRVHPAALNALAYGFGMQAGLGAVLWMQMYNNQYGLINQMLRPILSWFNAILTSPGCPSCGGSCPCTKLPGSC